MALGGSITMPLPQFIRKFAVAPLDVFLAKFAGCFPVLEGGPSNDAERSGGELLIPFVSLPELGPELRFFSNGDEGPE